MRCPWSHLPTVLQRVGRGAMITACIPAWSAHPHVNVNGRCFKQTGIIKNKKYPILVRGQILPERVHARTALYPISRCNDSRYNGILLYVTTIPKGFVSCSCIQVLKNKRFSPCSIEKIEYRGQSL